jgi:hypothetical protein
MIAPRRTVELLSVISAAQVVRLGSKADACTAHGYVREGPIGGIPLHTSI